MYNYHKNSLSNIFRNFFFIAKSKNVVTRSNSKIIPISCTFTVSKQSVKFWGPRVWNQLPTTELESRTQGSRPRPRTQKKSEAKAKDSLSEDRHSRGEGQECSRPRPRTKDTNACALQKKKGLHKNFSGDLHKKTFSKKFFKRSTKF